MRILKTILKDSSGLNFIEMIAGIAIFGVVSTVAMKNMSVTSNQIKSDQERVQIDSATKSISDLLKSKGLCNSALTNLDVNKLNQGVEVKASAGDTIKKCVKPEPPKFTGQNDNSKGKHKGDNKKGKKDRGNESKNGPVGEVEEAYKKAMSAYEKCLENAQKAADKPKMVATEAGLLDLSRTEIDLGKELGTGINLAGIEMNLGGTSGEVPLRFKITFNLPAPEGKVRQAVREVEFKVKVLDGKIDCDTFAGTEIFNNASAKLCAELGGSMVGGICDLSSGIDAELETRLRLAICEGLDASGSGALLANLCSKIELNGAIQGQNLSPNKIVINGDERNVFDNTNCSNYLSGYQVQGTKTCKELKFNFVTGGGADCSTYPAYQLTGTNTAVGSATCTQQSYSYDIGTDSCKGTTIATVSAGACKIFRSGTCSDNTAGTIEDVPNGTDCGGGKACSNGSCIAAPSCDTEFTITGTETATGTSYCIKNDKTVNFDLSGCDASTSRSATAGTCQRIRSGTCSGSTAAIIENYPDGTDCGGGKTCQSGTCKSGKPENKCYNSEAKCLAENDECFLHPGESTGGGWVEISYQTSFNCGKFSGKGGYCAYSDGQSEEVRTTGGGTTPKRKCDASSSGVLANCNHCATGNIDLVRRVFECKVVKAEKDQWCNYEEGGDPPPSPKAPKGASICPDGGLYRTESLCLSGSGASKCLNKGKGWRRDKYSGEIALCMDEDASCNDFWCAAPATSMECERMMCSCSGRFKGILFEGSFSECSSTLSSGQECATFNKCTYKGRRWPSTRKCDC